MFTNLGNAFATAFEYFTIIYLTGLGGLFSEKSGIVNIGLEGMMIIGGSGAYGVVHWGPVGGLAFGFLCGALYALIHAAATVTFKVDHIVSGVVINLAAVGVARFLSQLWFGQATQSNPGEPHLHTLNIPLLSKLPWGLGAAFQNMSPMVIVAFLLVFPVSYLLYRTRFGLRLRSTGENPEATRSLGVAVAPLQYVASCCPARWPAGRRVPRLRGERSLARGQTVGLGFIALAALILSNWDPSACSRRRCSSGSRRRSRSG
jgi:simple sugar transport system permease protein